MLCKNRQLYQVLLVIIVVFVLNLQLVLPLLGLQILVYCAGRIRVFVNSALKFLYPLPILFS